MQFIPKFYNKLNPKIDHISINTPEVIISEECVGKMEALAWSATKSGIETGGYFFGYSCGDNLFLIAFITGPGENAKKSSALFIADVEELQKKLDHYNEKFDAYWIGSWHVHPKNYCALSGTDMNSLTNTVNNPKCLDFFVAMVYSAYGDEMKVKAFVKKRGHTISQEANIRYVSASNIEERLLEDGVKLKPANNISTDVKKKMGTVGLNNFVYEFIDSYHIFKGDYNSMKIVLFVPINKNISPNLLVNDKLFFVPINWNDLCTTDDFIDSIDFNKINTDGGSVTSFSCFDRGKTKFYCGVRRRRRVVCHNRNKYIFIPLKSSHPRLVSHSNRYRKNK